MKNRLCQLRHTKSLTQQDLADQLLISRSTYSAYETGRHDLTLESLMLFADYYDVSLDYLLFRSNIPKSDVTLSEEELQLLSLFSKLNIHKRQVLFTLIYSLLENQNN